MVNRLTVAATTTTALHHDAGPAASLAEDQARYTYVGGGKFKPANDAARREVAAWNQYADRITARSTASRSVHL